MEIWEWKLYNTSWILRLHGKVIADVDAAEYYITHPYVNEYPSDNTESQKYIL